MVKNIHRFSPAAIIRTMIGMIGLCFLRQPLNAQNPAFFSPLNFPKVPTEVLNAYKGIATCNFAARPMNSAYSAADKGFLMICPLVVDPTKLGGIWLADVADNRLSNSRVLPPVRFTAVGEDGTAYAYNATVDDSNQKKLIVYAFDKQGKEIWQYALASAPANVILNPLPSGKLAVVYHDYPLNQPLPKESSVNLEILSPNGKSEQQTPISLKIPANGYIYMQGLRLITLPNNQFALFTPVYFKPAGQDEKTGVFLFQVISVDKKQTQQLAIIVPSAFAPGFRWNFSTEGNFVLVGYNREKPADPDKTLPQLQLVAYDLMSGQPKWVTDVTMPQPTKGFGICDVWNLEQAAAGGMYLACNQQTFQQGKVSANPGYDQFLIISYNNQGKETGRRQVLPSEVKSNPSVSLKYPEFLYVKDRRMNTYLGTTSDNRLVVIFSSPQTLVQSITPGKDQEIDFKPLLMYGFQSPLN